MSDICVSVVVPMYNVEKYIAECVDSIVSQTHSVLEIILVNDGSTDKTLEICSTFAEKDSRIKLIDKPNGGVTSCRTAGMKLAGGEYIYFADSDDILECDIIEKLLNACVSNNAQIAVCGFKKFGAGEQSFNVRSKYKVIEKEHFAEEIILPTINPSAGDMTELHSFYWNHFYKADCLKEEFFISDRICTREDTYTNLLVLDNVERVAVVEEMLYRYRTNMSSLTVAYRKGRLEKDLYFIAFAKKYLADRGISCDDRLQKMICSMALGNIDNFCKSGSYKIFKDGIRQIHSEEWLDEAIKNEMNTISSALRISAILYLKRLNAFLYLFRRFVFKMKGIG